MGWSTVVGSVGCVLVGIAMLTISIRSRQRARALELLPSATALVVEVPGEPGGPFVEFGSSQESSESPSAEPTLVSRALELRAADGGRVLVAEGSKLRVQKIVGAKREPAGPATTAEGGKIVRQFGFEVAPGTKLWLQGGLPPPEPIQGAGPYREGARVLEGDCMISGAEIKASVDDGCSVGCAVPMVLVLVGASGWGALSDGPWWTWGSLGLLLAGLGGAKILEPEKPPRV